MSQLEVDKIIPQSGTTLTIGDSGDTVNFADGTSIGIDTNTLYIDSTNNRVGIGTSSPSTKLHLASGSSGASPATGTHFFLESSGDTQLCISSPNANTSNIRFGSPSDASGAIISYDDTNNTLSLGGSSTNAFLRFVTGGASVERMRIDSSGNLLVGKSSLDYTTTGTIIRSDGSLFSTTNGANTAVFERLTSDGDIIRFEKDNTTVGRIGTKDTDLTIGNGGAGFLFLSSENRIRPFNVGTNSATDNVLTLGRSNTRFADLYLGGGVYLGGTGTANKLDDYEEGTWTPQYVNGPTINGAYGEYTKIGQIVHVIAKLYRDDATANSNTLELGNLPFAVAYDVSTAISHSGLGHATSYGGSTNRKHGMLDASGGNVNVIKDGTLVYATYDDFHSNARFATYKWSYITSA